MHNTMLAVCIHMGFYMQMKSLTLSVCHLRLSMQACVQARALSSAAEHHTNTALQPLHEYDDCMPNVMAALQRRERALLTAQTLGADLADAKSKLQAAQLSPATAAKKVGGHRGGKYRAPMKASLCAFMRVNVLC